MNILFLLTPKAKVSFIEEKDTVGSVMERMEQHGYTAIPMLSANGKYIGTITEGDLLWTFREQSYPNWKIIEDMSIGEVKRRRDNQAVRVEESMDKLLSKMKNQNFVPVVDDDNIFIGIVTRKDVLEEMAGKLKK